MVAIVAGQYAAWHGPVGIKAIANEIHSLSAILNKEAAQYGFIQKNKAFFDTLHFQTPVSAKQVCAKAVEKEINFNLIDDKHISISFDEVTTIEHVNLILSIFADLASKKHTDVKFVAEVSKGIIPQNLSRKSEILTHEIFSKYHSETEMMRYLKKLEVKDLSLNRAMIPLGSCTMKLNAAAEMIPFTWVEFGNIHPFVPKRPSSGLFGSNR